MNQNNNKVTKDTTDLLKECDAGTKMAVSSINEVCKNVSDPKLFDLLTESKKHHEKLGNELHELLLKNNSSQQEPNPIAKGMSWIKTNIKISMDDSDKTIADLITDGCDMGIKSLYQYLHQYQSAESYAVSICKRLIEIEEQLRKDLHEYL